YCAERKGTSWAAPIRLSATINAGPSDTSPSLSPDGATLLFYSERAGGLGQADVYISGRKDGAWQPAQNLGPIVNSTGYDYNPSVSRDGNTLFFGRDRRIWSIPVAELNPAIIRPDMFR